MMSTLGFDKILLFKKALNHM